MNKTAISKDLTPSELISDQITNLADWRGELLARIRRQILEAEPGIVEDWKWGSAIWTKNGMICSGGVFKDHVKLLFSKGAMLEDSKGLFNSGLDAKETPGIDLFKGDKVDEDDLQELVRTAIAFNLAGVRKK